MTKILFTESTLVRSRTISVEVEGAASAEPAIETSPEVEPPPASAAPGVPAKVIPFAAVLQHIELG